MTTDPSGNALLAHGEDLYDIDAIAREIQAYTGEPPETVWRRLAQELHRNGTNVIHETRRFGVTPFVFDQKMIDFYTRSDGFIYETCVESRHPFRLAKWLRIAAFLDETRRRTGQNQVLVYGDSVGNDCIFLRRMNFEVSYHDYDSYCSRFAKQRFASRQLEVRSFTPGARERFDFVICFEVAEHVPDPVALVAELADLTADRGYCIFSESFGLIKPQFPTHLQSNVPYVGQSDRLFAAHGLHVAWRDDAEKPIVYSRLAAAPAQPGLVRRVARRVRRKLRAAYHA